MRLDLHVHSAASDGALPPEAVVRLAAEGGLDVMALADHDTTAGFARAYAVGRQVGVEVVPALEVSSTHEGRDVHVLGYFVDPEAEALRKHATHAVGRREDRMREMLTRLRAQGVDVPYEAILAAAGAEAVSIGRPHLAKALVERGHVGSVPAAFDTLIGDQHPAFVPTLLLTPVEAVALVLAAGGVPVWAHPPRDLLDPLLPSLRSAGLRGLEVYRPRSSRSDVQRLEQACQATGLVRSGGSDWHGPDGGSTLGDFHVTADEVSELLSAGGM